MKTVYHFLDYWKKEWRSCKVEILSETEKTCTIKLLEFGPNNAPPGSILKRVHKTSLDAFKAIKEANPFTPRRQWGTFNYM